MFSEINGVDYIASSCGEQSAEWNGTFRPGCIPFGRLGMLTWRVIIYVIMKAMANHFILCPAQEASLTVHCFKYPND